MFRFKKLTLAVACGGIAGTAVAAITYSQPGRQIDPLLTSSANCVLPGKNGATLKRYIQLAAAKNELKPFNRAADAPSPTLDDGVEVPLWNSLGPLTYAISTQAPVAQRYFDQGIKLAYAFNHAEAQRAFRKAQSLDPQCAMCFWGEALVLGPNINAPMDAAANPRALRAIERAQALAAGAAPKERILIAAVTAG
jgi:hypothetical protein